MKKENVSRPYNFVSKKKQKLRSVHLSILCLVCWVCILIYWWIHTMKYLIYYPYLTRIYSIMLEEMKQLVAIENRITFSNFMISVTNRKHNHYSSQKKRNKKAKTITLRMTRKLLKYDNSKTFEQGVTQRQ